MKKYAATARDAVRTQLWPIPTAAVVVAAVLGILVPRWDAHIDPHLAGWLDAVLFGGDAGAARSLLEAISGSLITVTSLTFSLTVVTLQLASSQFSPRLLRTFTSDSFVQWTLALFLSTFIYSLTVLRGIRTGDDQSIAVVPKVGVSLGFVLALASVVGLVLFLAHLTEQIRVETMLRNVHDDASATMSTVLTIHDPSAPAAHPPLAPSTASTLLAIEDGFLTWVAEEALVKAAVDADAVVEVTVSPGRYLVTGTPVGKVWSRSGGRPDPETAHRLREQAARCLHVGFERTSAQDVGYGLRQLTDVTNKALSPGINDPTTAIHALGHISSFLCALSQRDLGPALLRDDDERVRVVLHQPDLATYIDLGISQPRRYGASDPQVLAGIGQVLLDLAHRVRPEQRHVITAELHRLRTTISDQDFDQSELASLDRLLGQVETDLISPTPQETA